MCASPTCGCGFVYFPAHYPIDHSSERSLFQAQHVQKQVLKQNYIANGKWQPTPVFLPGESNGERSLMGCSAWNRKELDTTEAT